MFLGGAVRRAGRCSKRSASLVRLSSEIEMLHCEISRSIFLSLSSRGRFSEAIRCVRSPPQNFPDTVM